MRKIEKIIAYRRDLRDLLARVFVYSTLVEAQTTRSTFDECIIRFFLRLRHYIHWRKALWRIDPMRIVQ